MDSEDIIPLLGKRDDDPAVKRLLADSGVTKKLRLPNDDDEVRVQLHKRGLTLIVEPEGRKTSILKFVEAQFYTDAEEGAKTFSGQLPQGLQFSDTQAQVRRKLGKPADSLKEAGWDSWKVDGLDLTVTYRKKDNQIILVQIGMPS